MKLLYINFKYLNINSLILYTQKVSSEILIIINFTTLALIINFNSTFLLNEFVF
jgi:hypothetical protein